MKREGGAVLLGRWRENGCWVGGGQRRKRHERGYIKREMNEHR